MKESTDKLKLIHLALRITGMFLEPKHLELVVRIQQAVDLRNGDLTLTEIIEIRDKIEYKYQSSIADAAMSAFPVETPI